MLLLVSTHNRQYLDGVAQEISEALAESGQIILADLAPRFGLTTDFLVQVPAPIRILSLQLFANANLFSRSSKNDWAGQSKVIWSKALFIHTFLLNAVRLKCELSSQRSRGTNPFHF